MRVRTALKITDILGKKAKKKAFLKQWIKIIGLDQIKEISVTISPIGEYKVVKILREDGLITLLTIPNEAIPREKETS
jgi:uncharacterized protein (DUF2384 family)